jgi:hypothetical protein
VPQKGQGIQSVNQLSSSMSSVLNMDKAKSTGSHAEVVRSIKPKDLRDQYNSAGNLISWQK